MGWSQQHLITSPTHLILTLAAVEEIYGKTPTSICCRLIWLLPTSVVMEWAMEPEAPHYFYNPPDADTHRHRGNIWEDAHIYLLSSYLAPPHRSGDRAGCSQQHLITFPTHLILTLAAVKRNI